MLMVKNHVQSSCLSHYNPSILSGQIQCLQQQKHPIFFFSGMIFFKWPIHRMAVLGKEILVDLTVLRLKPSNLKVPALDPSFLFSPGPVAKLFYGYTFTICVRDTYNI